MLNPKLVEEKPELLRKSIKERDCPLMKDAENFIKLRKEWKVLKAKVDALRHRRNTISLAINDAIKQGKKQEAAKKKQEARTIAETVKKANERIASIEAELKHLELNLPNFIADKLPKKPKVTKKHGKEKKQKWHKDYLELTEKQELIDFEQAVAMSGTGFYALKGDVARLQRALINFCLDFAKKKGYKEITLPVLLNEKAVTNSGHLPKFREGMYQTTDGFFLSPTEEVGLLNLYANKLLRKADLPIYMTSFTASFRTEKGATKGIARTHQFDEVELFKFTEPKDSSKELQSMVKDAAEILKLLKLPYRILLLPANDLSYQNSITYDIETFASRTGWLEVSSCSNCLDYQARRAKIKYLTKQGKKDFVHTLNGTGLGLNRVLIAILENNQQKDGSIKVPKVLHKYVGKQKISLQ